METLKYEGNNHKTVSEGTIGDVKTTVAHALVRGHMDDDEMREIEPGQQFIGYQFLHQDV